LSFKERIERKRVERELFFWTADQALRLSAKVGILSYAVWCLATGDTPPVEQVLRLFASGQ